MIRLKEAKAPPDQQQVVAKLETVLGLARQGDVSGVMLVVRGTDGSHICGSAGWYERQPMHGLIPALQGVIDLCSRAGAND